MTKKLKIRFVKFEKSLAMQILEQEGIFDKSEHVIVRTCPSFDDNCVSLRGRERKYDLLPDFICFSSNAERDKYLARAINWITDEQFTNGESELKVGDIYEYSIFGDGIWENDKLIAILPAQYRSRFIFDNKRVDGGWIAATYARPFAQRVEPTIDGDVYTWKMEVAE